MIYHFVNELLHVKKLVSGHVAFVRLYLRILRIPEAYNLPKWTNICTESFQI